jgi:ribosomal protein S12 methylthiotransferase
MTRLVEALLAGTAFPWIRFLYAYPTTLDRELLALMGNEERFVSYLDMPLQHSHPEVLKAMRRGGSARRYLRLLEEARRLAPDVFLRTTFIVGFPGETEERFAHLLAFVRAARFDHLGAFVWSAEPGTPAAELGGRVPRSAARRRYERLLAAQEPIARARRELLVGRRMRALVEGVHEETEHLLVARHQGQAPEIDGRILINDGAARPGTLAEVEITAAYADDLVGRVVGPAGAPGVVPAAPLAAVEAAAG